jgi:hypothetical protein
MMNFQCIISSIVLAVATLLFTSPLIAAENPMDCIGELAIPSFRGLVATYIPAIIQVRITIGQNGKAQSVDYSGAKGNFPLELNTYFRDKTRYVDSCAGKTISFTVRYLVEGNRTGFPVSEVRFRPPDEITVICHPLEPALDPYRTQDPFKPQGQDSRGRKSPAQ